MSQPDLNGNPTSTAVPAAAAAGGAIGGVRGAIARASQATGVDFSYLLAQARLESSLDPKAQATASSAAGLYQFTRGTWETMLARHGAVLANSAASPLPASPAKLMALRNDPDAAAMMAAELAGDNTTALTPVLGRAPSSSELYLAHFLGAAGATRFLGGLASDPGQSAAALLPKAAAANPGVFYDAGGTARSVGEMMALIQTRMDGALQDGAGQDVAAVAAPGASDFGTTIDPDGLGPPIVTAPAGGPIAQQFNEAQAASAPDGAGASMADTLRSTFGVSPDSNGSGDTPAFVRSAYGRMQDLGL